MSSRVSIKCSEVSRRVRVQSERGEVLHEECVSEGRETGPTSATHMGVDASYNLLTASCLKTLKSWTTERRLDRNMIPG